MDSLLEENPMAHSMAKNSSQNYRNAGSQSLRRREAGFTLVELLVVTAIISVLAGMLLPVLGKTVEYAHKVQCANQLRQFGLANGIYADSWSGYSVPFSGLPADADEAHNDYWAKYLNLRILGQNTLAKGRKPSLMLCPSDPEPKSDSQSTSYGINYNLDCPAKNSRLASPSKAAFVIETQNVLTGGNYLGWEQGLGNSRSAGFHQGSLNILWADDHVNSRKQGCLLTEEMGPFF
mgnify:CR=1 FL=1